ncbi:MAG: hypothetical protein HUJ26_23055 [Planctomycetaceae bacterium]|nr:hypothetical protein [Planctomycetaceae bacterium]
MPNAINVIYPYKFEGLWVFDDEAVDLVKEPFVEGADTMIDVILEEKGIQNADRGFRLIFSSGEFPRYDVKFDWVREGEGGNWYRSEAHQVEGWLCPALLRYFETAPQEIYARFEEKSDS